MTDIAKIAATYIAAWNETDTQRRAALLDAHWTEDAAYADPLMAGQGRGEIAGLIAGVHSQFPGFRFQLLGRPDGHGAHGRFSWGLGPDGAEPLIEGTDFVEIADGRLRRVTGFLDKVPA
ncbi:MAG TPA: nuclear transport factor 2 family protein [Devosiaceae bacterium]|jgi:hypothetical protein